MTTVLVTGASGNVGGHVVRELVARGVSVRAFVRDPRRAADRLGAGVDLAVGDFADLASVRRAMKGVDSVFVTSSNGPDEVAHENAVVDAAAAEWVRRIVKLSALGAEVGSPLMFADAHARIERHLLECGVPSVVLRASFFMSNLFASADTIREAGTIVAPAADAKIAMIDPRDIAAVAAAVLVDDGPPADGGCDGGRSYVLTGPRAVTYTEVAADLSTVLGREVRYVDVPDEAARAGMLASGAPEWLADSLVVLYGLLRDGLAAHPTADVRTLTGREPRTFAEFARDHRSAF
jgi:uncharacterized protein YbjT (DUF2867 family)